MPCTAASRAPPCRPPHHVPVADVATTNVDGASTAAEPAARRCVRASCAGRLHRPDRGQHDRVSLVELATDGEARRTWSSADDVRRGFTLQLEQPRHRGARVERQRVVPAELRDRGVERVAGVLLGRVRAGCARTARGRRLRSSVVPEVEQAAGDDVALDLGSCRRRWSPPASRGTRCANGHCRRRRRCVTAAGNASATRSNTACSAVASSTLSIDVSAPSVSPLGHAVVRGARAGAERVDELRHLAQLGRIDQPGVGRVEQISAAGGAGTRRAATAPCCARTAAGPWRTPTRRLRRRACGRTERARRRRTPRRTPARRASSRSAARDARRVHVDEQRGDAPVRRLERAGPREQHTPLRVLRQAGPHLLAGHPPPVVGATARHVRDAEVAARCPARRTPDTRPRRRAAAAASSRPTGRAART